MKERVPLEPGMRLRYTSPHGYIDEWEILPRDKWKESTKAAARIVYTSRTKRNWRDVPDNGWFKADGSTICLYPAWEILDEFEDWVRIAREKAGAYNE